MFSIRPQSINCLVRVSFALKIGRAGGRKQKSSDFWKKIFKHQYIIKIKVKEFGFCPLFLCIFFCFICIYYVCFYLYAKTLRNTEIIINKRMNTQITSMVIKKRTQVLFSCFNCLLILLFKRFVKHQL